MYDINVYNGVLFHMYCNSNGKFATGGIRYVSLSLSLFAHAADVEFTDLFGKGLALARRGMSTIYKVPDIRDVC